MRKTYIDNLDQRIFPFISSEGYDDRYPTHTILEYPKEFYQEVRNASDELFKIFCKTVEVFKKCPDEFMTLMDIPEKIRPYLNIPNMLNLPTFISRFDYVLDENNQIKMVEINADTPCAIVEAYYGNQIAADYVNKQNPNTGCLQHIKDLLNYINQKTRLNFRYNSKTKMILDSPFVFSCFDDYIEDYATTKFLMETLDVQQYELGDKKTFVSFYDLQVDDNGVLLPDGHYARVLYRLHPLELLIDEKSADGYPIGTKLLDLYKEGKVFLINPPESLIMQSKGFQALVWSLYETNQFFTEDERTYIAKYMVPSYFEEGAIKNTGKDYVKKPIWGREGTGITLHDASGEIIETKVNDLDPVERKSMGFLYQDFIKGNLVQVETDSGKHGGDLTISCFMIKGSASAVYSRFSTEKIAGLEAYWVPLVIK